MHIEEKISQLEKKLQDIEERNRKVESDKAWETSWFRKILLMIFTYLAISLYLQYIVHIDPWINAVVPSIGFLLSTLTLPYFKELWKNYFYKK